MPGAVFPKAAQYGRKAGFWGLKKRLLRTSPGLLAARSRPPDSRCKNFREKSKKLLTSG
jgi:hypothetical protein